MFYFLNSNSTNLYIIIAFDSYNDKLTYILRVKQNERYSPPKQYPDISTCKVLTCESEAQPLEQVVVPTTCTKGKHKRLKANSRVKK